MTLVVDIRHDFGRFNVDAQFEAAGGVTALFGRSGAGKTTIVNAVAGLLRPSGGRIALGDRVLFDAASGTHVAPHRRRIGYVFQDGRLFPHLNVRKNLLFGAPSGGDAKSFSHVVDLLAVGALLDQPPGTLSGGEKQRVAIGRALLTEPELLLMDEPLASLDAARKSAILPYLERLRDDTRVPILYVSHSANEIARLATTVVLLENGRVQAAASAPEIFSDPENVHRLGLREAGALVGARILAHAEDGLTQLSTTAGPLFLPQVDAPIGAHLRVRIAAQDVILATERPRALSALNVLEGTVSAIRLGDGPGAIVQVLAGDERVMARLTRRSVEALNLTLGQTVYAVVKSVSVDPTDIGTGLGN